MAYNPVLACLLVVELIVIIGFLVYSLLLIKLFFEKRTSLPRLIIIYNIAGLVFGFLNAIAVEYVNGKTITWMYPSLFGALVSCLIWVPYFHSSIRVKETFSRRLPDPGDKQPVPVLERPLEAEGLQPH